MPKPPQSTKHPIPLILAITTLSILFFISGPDYHSPRSFKAAWNFGHIIYFALLPLLIVCLPLNKKLKSTPQIIIIIAATLILGTLVELLQYGSDRTPDMGDLFRNIIGAMVAIFFLLPLKRSIPKTTLRTMEIITLLLAATQLYPIAIALIDEHHARRDFPILSDLQTPFQIHRWTDDANMSIENTPDQPNNRTLRISLSTHQYSGVSLRYFPTNWTNHQWLQLCVYNPSTDSLSLTCRIHDKKHIQGIQRYQDRFNKTYTISQGWNTITISLKQVQQSPDTRQMDLSQILGIGIFATRLPHPRTIYIDDLKLF